MQVQPTGEVILRVHHERGSPVHAMRTTMRQYAAANGDLSSERFFAADRNRCRSSASQCLEHLHVLGTLAFARLQRLFCCTLEGGRSPVADIAVVFALHSASMSVSTSQGCRRLDSRGRAKLTRFHAPFGRCARRASLSRFRHPANWTVLSRSYRRLGHVCTLKSSEIYLLFCYNHRRNYRCSHSSPAPFAIYARTWPPAPPA